MRRVAVPMSFLFVAAICCGPSSSEEPKPEPETETTQFERFLHDYLAAFNAGDAGRLALFCRDDAINVPPAGPELVGRAAVEGYYEDFFAQLKPEITQYVPEYRFAQDWVFVREEWKMRVEPLASDAVLMVGTSLWGGKRTDGNWEVLWQLCRLESPLADLKP
jgi:ketosteroid isomerase-like protein